MARVVFSPDARLDLIQLVDFLTDAASPRIARRYETEIKRVIRNLGRMPSTGSPRPVFGPHVRVLIVRPYLIFYDDVQETGEATVLRILHGSRNITPGMIRPGET